MATRKPRIKFEKEVSMPRYPDNKLMHILCRIWQSDWDLAIKFVATREVVRAMVEIEKEKEPDVVDNNQRTTNRFNNNIE